MVLCVLFHACDALAKQLDGSGTYMATDGYFTSPILFSRLAERYKVYAVGTLQGNVRGLSVTGNFWGYRGRTTRKDNICCARYGNMVHAVDGLEAVAVPVYGKHRIRDLHSYAVQMSHVPMVVQWRKVAIEGVVAPRTQRDSDVEMPRGKPIKGAAPQSIYTHTTGYAGKCATARDVKVENRRRFREPPACSGRNGRARSWKTRTGCMCPECAMAGGVAICAECQMERRQTPVGVGEGYL